MIKIESIKVNGDECLSGSFIASVDDKNEITFSRDAEKIIIVFNFKEKEDKQVLTNFSGGGTGKDLTISIELPLLNDDSQGILRPMKFASFDNGDQIYLQLWIRKIAKPYVVIDYSIYIKNAIK
jgi:hypothetical protein